MQKVNNQAKGKTMKTITVWLLNGDKNDSNSKVVEVKEGFKTRRAAKRFAEKSLTTRKDVVDFKIGPAF